MGVKGLKTYLKQYRLGKYINISQLSKEKNIKLIFDGFALIFKLYQDSKEVIINFNTKDWILGGEYENFYNLIVSYFYNRKSFEIFIIFDGCVRQNLIIKG
jgi:hypothetical protein